MNFLQQVLKHKSELLKYVAIGLGALVVVLVLFNVAGVDVREGARTIGVAPDMDRGVLIDSYNYGYGEESVRSMEGYTTPSVGIMPPPYGGYVPGDDAESLEVTEYNVSFEVGDRDSVCGAVLALKDRSDVVFVSAHEYERGCTYTFKVAAHAALEMRTHLESLDPRDIHENTYTIRQIVGNYEQQVDMLRTKLASLESTLSQAIAAYDDVMAAATRAQDVETLARIIDSKVSIIERLTMERIAVNAQLAEMERAKADQLDRIEYTYFNVNVYETPIFDGREIKDSWVRALKNSIRDANAILQQLSVGLIALFFLLVQYALYFVILLFVAKYGWRFARDVWKK